MRIHTFFIPKDHPGHDVLYERTGGAFCADGDAWRDAGVGADLDYVSGGPNICVCQALADMLTGDELDAVLAHEYAHIALGHLDHDREGEVDLFAEMEADLVSGRITGPAAVWSALVVIGDALGAGDDRAFAVRLSTLFSQI